MVRKSIAPNDNMFEVASRNASVHCQLEVNLCIIRQPCQDVTYSLGLVSPAV